MRYALPAVLLVVVATAFAAGWVANVDFANWDRDRWLPVKEKAFPEIGKMVQHDTYIENYIPAGAADKDVLGCRVGTALMLLKDFNEADFAARVSLAFEGKGAPGLLLRVQRDGVITGKMYSLILYKDGVNLWRYSGEKWAKVAFVKFPVSEKEFHTMTVQVRGTSFLIGVDHKLVLEAKEAESLPAGEIGLWLGEGVCRAKDFAVRPLR